MLEIPVVLALVLLNGYFAMSELAVVSARRARLQARDGGRGARLALALAREPGRMAGGVSKWLSWTAGASTRCSSDLLPTHAGQLGARDRRPECLSDQRAGSSCSTSRAQ